MKLFSNLTSLIILLYALYYLIQNPELMKKQIHDVSNTLDEIKSKTSSSAEAAAVVSSYLGV